MPLFLHCCHQRPSITLCRLSLWSSELVLPNLEISQSESLTRALFVSGNATLSALRRRRLDAPFSLIHPSINSSGRDESTVKYRCQKESYTPSRAGDIFGDDLFQNPHVSTCLLHLVSAWDSWPDPWSSKAACWRQPYLLLTSALEEKKKKNPDLFISCFILSFSGTLHSFISYNGPFNLMVTLRHPHP